MSADQSKFKIRDRNGNHTDIDFHVSEYEQAAKHGMNLSQYLSQKYAGATDEQKYGPVISQMMQAARMFLGNDRLSGLRSPTMREIMTDGIQISNLIRPDGSERNTPAGRLLFPEIIMRTMESNLMENYDDFIGGWTNAIAITDTINGSTFDQPLINTTGAEASRAAPIGQLSLPNQMIGITTSNMARKIATRSIGVQISDEAAASTTLQLVNVVMAAQSRGERIAMIEEDIDAVLNGDTDRSTEAALSAVTAETLDSTLSANGTLSHLAWIKYLRRNYRKRMIDTVICDLAAALAITGRSGKPNYTNVYQAPSDGTGVDANVENLNIRSPKIIVVDDGVVAANTVLGFDSRYALRRVINISAQYSAIEEFVMRRGTGFRVDYGEITHRLWDDAFEVLSLTAS